MNEPLSYEAAFPLNGPCRQIELVVDPSLVLRRHGYLNDFRTCVTLKNAMANFRRLHHTIPRLEPKRFSLILVNHSYPSFQAVDRLKVELVIMHIVRNNAAGGQSNM
jgi:hypothetical protein